MRVPIEQNGDQRLVRVSQMVERWSDLVLTSAHLVDAVTVLLRRCTRLVWVTIGFVLAIEILLAAIR